MIVEIVPLLPFISLKTAMAIAMERTMIEYHGSSVEAYYLTAQHLLV